MYGILFLLLVTIIFFVLLGPLFFITFILLLLGNAILAYMALYIWKRLTFRPDRPDEQFFRPAVWSGTGFVLEKGVFLIVAQTLCFIQYAVAQNVANSWTLERTVVPDEKAPDKLKCLLILDFVNRTDGKKDIKFDEDARIALGSLKFENGEFQGLAFNGTLADPKMLTLWILNNQADRNKNGRQSRAEEFTPESMEMVSGEVEKQATWTKGVRWLHRLCGSDAVGFVVLVLAYTVFFHCVIAYSRRARHFSKCRNYWTKPRRDELQGKKEPEKAALEFLESQEANPKSKHLLDELYDGQTPVILPLKILRAAAQARQASPASASLEIARSRYCEDVNRIEERYEARLATVQYYAQIIAPLGFIGTVLHLGLAMGHAQTLTGGGGIGRVTSSLGMAFDTTFVALVMWILVEFLAVREKSNRRQVRVEAERMVTRSVFATTNGSISIPQPGSAPP